MFDDDKKIIEVSVKEVDQKQKASKFKGNGNFFQLFSFVLISSKDKTRFCSNHNSNQRKLAMEKVRKKKTTEEN